MAHLSASFESVELLTPQLATVRPDDGRWMLRLGRDAYLFTSATDLDRIAMSFAALAADLLAREIAEENERAAQVEVADVLLARALGERPPGYFESPAADELARVQDTDVAETCHDRGPGSLTCSLPSGHNGAHQTRLRWGSIASWPATPEPSSLTCPSCDGTGNDFNAVEHTPCGRCAGRGAVAHGTERLGAPVEDLPGVWIVDAAVAS